MLVLFFADIRSEEWTPSYAGAASRIDFVMPEFELAVELKHTRVSLKAKELGEQIMVDCERYKKHEGVRHLVCLVFDHEGYIVNPRGIEQDLSRDHSGEDLAVTVSIFDR